MGKGFCVYWSPVSFNGRWWWLLYWYITYAGTAINSHPIERIVSIISSKRFLDGFFVPLTYWANKLWEISKRRAMAAAFNSGWAINKSYRGLDFLSWKNPSKLKSSSSSLQYIPSWLVVKFARCAGVAYFSLWKSENFSHASFPSVVRIHTSVSVNHTFSTMIFSITTYLDLLKNLFQCSAITSWFSSITDSTSFSSDDFKPLFLINVTGNKVNLALISPLITGTCIGSWSLA